MVQFHPRLAVCPQARPGAPPFSHGPHRLKMKPTLPAKADITATPARAGCSGPSPSCRLARTWQELLADICAAGVPSWLWAWARGGGVSALTHVASGWAPWRSAPGRRPGLVISMNSAQHRYLFPAAPPPATSAVARLPTPRLHLVLHKSSHP